MATTVQAADTHGEIARYAAARERGVAWLLDRCNADGSLGHPEEGFHFYRAPWTLTAAGHGTAASAICGWIRRNMLTPDGTIGGPYRVYDDAYAYRNATLIIGAQMAQQYDLSHGLVPNLLAWQDPVSGGFACDRTADGGRSDRMDIPYTCGPGFACLATGYLDAARAVYRFLAAIYAAQTDLPKRFYYAWSRAEQRPITEFPEDRQHMYVVENQEARAQRWTIGGIAAGFLCRLYLAEPKPEYLALARRYQAFSMAATERQFDYPQVCKSSWGSSLLYQLTGEGEYLRWTHRMGDWYVRMQEPDGSWRWWNREQDTLGLRIELTLEFVMHLDTLLGGLASLPQVDHGGPGAAGC